MHRTPMDTDEQERKRNRNRLAQQKYRKKLKSHIEDLERRAAAANELAKVNTAASPLDNVDMSPFWHYTSHLNGQMIHHHHHNPEQQQRQLSTASASPPQICNPSAINHNTESNLSSSTSTLDCLQKKPAGQSQGSYPGIPEKDVMLSLPDDSDFLKAFTISDESSWANQKNLSIHDPGNTLGMQPDNNVEGDASLLRSMPSLSPSAQSNSLESRIDYILRSIQTVGFESPDSFVSCYYTARFKDRSPLKLAQAASRGKGLPHILEELQAHASSWSTWESGAYRDTIVRSAAYIIADEFDRLTKKKYSCEMDLQHNLYRTTQEPTATDASSTAPIHQLHGIAAELKKTLCEEVPNLYTLTETFSVQESPIPHSTRINMLLATIRIIAASDREPLQEAANWAYTRAHSRFPAHSSDLSVEECDETPI